MSITQSLTRPLTQPLTRAITRSITQAGAGGGGGGGGSGDPDFAYRSAVLNFNGTYTTGNAFTEPKGHGVTVISGASISGGEMTLDGVGGKAQIADSADFDFGTGDFLIEILANFSTIAGETYQTIYAHGYVGAGHLLVQTGNADGKFMVYMGGSVICTESSGASSGVDYWYEIGRSGTTVFIKRNGTTTASGTSSANLNAADDVCIGGAKSSGSTHGFKGVIKAARISKGISASTNPPSDPLPES